MTILDMITTSRRDVTGMMMMMIIIMMMMIMMIMMTGNMIYVSIELLSVGDWHMLLGWKG
jgi:hypothetical protein